MIKPADYTYAVARIRMNEAKLFSDEELYSLIAAEDCEEIIGRLKDRGWGDELVSETAVTLTETEQKRLWKFMAEIVPDGHVFDFFTVKNDYRNLKSVLKAFYSGKDTAAGYTTPASLSLAELEKAVSERSFAPLHGMAPVAEEAYDVLTRTGDGQAADLIIDRAALRLSYEATQKTGDPFIAGFGDLWAALTDIKTAFRAARNGKDGEFITENTVATPALDVRALAEAAVDGPESLISYLTRGSFAACGEALKISAEALEKACDDMIIEYCKRAKLETFGTSPLFAYVIAKETELRSVRIILSAKNAGLSDEEIKSKVRRSYV